MKLGISSYSFSRLIQSGKMNILEIIDLIAAIGGEHVEIVPIGFELTSNPKLVQQIRERAESAGIEVSNYLIHADFLKSDDDYEQEIKRVCNEVDIAYKLGAKQMRHDVGPFNVPSSKNNLQSFICDLPKIVKGCRKIADYASEYGIKTTVENHGYYINGSERLLLLLQEVNHNNLNATLDVGNFLCVDENPEIGVSNLLPFATMIHVKDFYHRKAFDMTEKIIEKKLKSGLWFNTLSGNLLRGAITGDGDIVISKIIKNIKKSGYEGYLSIEFEGFEDCIQASRLGFEYVSLIRE